MRAALASVPLVATGSPYLVAPGRVTKPDGSPYQVFTPFLRRWRETGWRPPAKTGAASARWLDPARLGITACEIPDPGATLDLVAGEAAARNQWKSFVDNGLANYADDRNRPDIEGTSRMSAHLKFGTIHPRTLVADLDLRAAGARTYLRELAFATSMPTYCITGRPARGATGTAPSTPSAPTPAPRPAAASRPGRPAKPVFRSSTPECANCARPDSCTTGCA